MYVRECELKYDNIKCAGLDHALNHTIPTEAELLSRLPTQEENPYFWHCEESNIEEYDWDEDTSMDVCKGLLETNHLGLSILED